MSFFKKLFSAFTTRERITFIVSGIIAVVSFVVVIGIAINHGTIAIPTVGGEYNEGVVGQPEYVNPVIASSQTDLGLVKMIYSNVDDIADSIQSSTDGRTWTVHLKDNLKWQDGQQLTSDDVIFTVQSIQDPDANSPLALAWQGVTVNRVSELELTFTLASPYAFFGDDLANLYIVPKHLFADVPPGNWRLSEYDLKPIGSGPYKFNSYNQESDGFISNYDLAAWNQSPTPADNTGPLIQNFNFNFFRNQSDLSQSFNTGQIDGFELTSPSDLASIERPYNLFSWNTPSYYAVFFNQSQNLALQDPAVRTALGEAVDRTALVNEALDGDGTATYGPIPPGAPYSISIMQSTSLELASETLTDAGWTVGTNGLRSKTIQKSVIPLTVNLTVPQVDFLVQTADILQSTWQSIGVTTNIATDSPETIEADSITNRGYESLIFGNTLGPSSDLYSFWDSSQRFSPGLNLAIYSDPVVDKLIESAREDMNMASRTAQFAEIQNDIVADTPAVFLYSPDDLYVADKSVQGVTTNFLPDPSDRLREVPQWYLDTTRVLK